MRETLITTEQRAGRAAGRRRALHRRSSPNAPALTSARRDHDNE